MFCVAKHSHPRRQSPLVGASVWHFGREFGTYLDDVDQDVPDLGPGQDKRCLRCGSRFSAYHNDAHRAGFCSQACMEAFSKRQGRPSAGPPVEKD